MNKMDAALSLIKLSAATVAATVPATAYIVPGWSTTPYTFVLAGIGAAMSYAWDPKREENGMGLVAKWLVVTLFSVALVVVLPDIAKWDLAPTSAPPLAFILALYGRRIMPALKNAIPMLGRGIASMFSSRGGGGGSYMDEPPMDDPRTDPARKGRDEPPTDDRGY